MNLLKSVVVATTLAVSVGTFSTPVSAVCLGMACMYNRMTPLQAIMMTEAQVGEAIIALDDKRDDKAIIKEIKQALRATKEINANDKVDRNRMRANTNLKNARKYVKKGDLVKAREELIIAKKRFKGLEGMLELSQADRTSQQTHFLNRILGTVDEGAGSRSSNK